MAKVGDKVRVISEYGDGGQTYSRGDVVEIHRISQCGDLFIGIYPDGSIDNALTDDDFVGIEEAV